MLKSNNVIEFLFPIGPQIEYIRRFTKHNYDAEY